MGKVIETTHLVKSSREEESSRVINNKPPLRRHCNNNGTPMRKVHFSEAPIIIKNYEKDWNISSKNEIWYTEQELSTMKDILHQQVKYYRDENHHQQQQHEEDGGENTDKWTWRGFEYVLHRLPRKQLRREHVWSVLYFQSVLGCSAITATAVANYASNSSDANGSLKRAIAHAIQDEIDALKIHHEKPNNQQQQGTMTTLEVEEEQCDDHNDSEAGAPTANSMSASTRTSRKRLSVVEHPQNDTTTTTTTTLSLKLSPWKKMRKFFHCL